MEAGILLSFRFALMTTYGALAIKSTSSKKFNIMVSMALFNTDTAYSKLLRWETIQANELFLQNFGFTGNKK